MIRRVLEAIDEQGIDSDSVTVIEQWLRGRGWSPAGDYETGFNVRSAASSFNLVPGKRRYWRGPIERMLVMIAEQENNDGSNPPTKMTVWVEDPLGLGATGQTRLFDPHSEQDERNDIEKLIGLNKPKRDRRLSWIDKKTGRGALNVIYEDIHGLEYTIREAREVFGLKYTGSQS